MEIQKQIQLEMKEAMKSQNKAKLSILRVLIGEFNREGKEVTDEKAIAIIKKMVENAKSNGALDEVYMLSEYLPKQLGEEELTEIILSEIQIKGYSSRKDMGQIMGFLKANFAGHYDGKLASRLVMENLS